MIVNPDIVEAQMESAIIFGLSAALYGEITLKDGRVEQSNFHDYPILRIDEMPRDRGAHRAEQRAARAASASPARRHSRPPSRTRCSR